MRLEQEEKYTTNSKLDQEVYQSNDVCVITSHLPFLLQRFVLIIMNEPSMRAKLIMTSYNKTAKTAK